MIAYHYPPCAVSSGQQRTLSFSRHLPKLGWQPIILTISSNAYSRVTEDQLSDIPPNVEVVRALALDTMRHLSFRGHYPGWMAVPDPWISWCASATLAGFHLIRKHKPKVLWSTYPIATAHLVSYLLHRLTKIPWVADFRDPMNEVDPVTKERWPKDPKIWKAREWIESHTIRSCARAVFVTQGARHIYAERYPDVGQGRLSIIANGYSEETFAAAEALRNHHKVSGKKIVLLHSGVLYPTPDRHPQHFFAALARLKELGEISEENLQVILRASSSENLYQRQILEYMIEDIVKLKPPLPYNQALREMLDADGLLIFQGRDSNSAIPAKFYEYLRARRPIFALVDDKGDTAAELRRAAIGTIVPLSSTDQIVTGLVTFLHQVREGTAAIASDSEIKTHSRESKTRDLARLFDSLIRDRV
jgi:glycosyltransferase involved in cell wall biosynthesis